MKSKQILMIALALVISTSSLSAQKIYDPNANAKKDIAKAVELAKTSNKHVLLQIGGNWCPWCIKLNNLFISNSEIRRALKNNYVYVKVNYSRQNRNVAIMKSLGYPNRFGFPVLVILDANGKRIHTQNTVYLEKDKSYDEKKIKKFLKDWSVKAVRGEKYW